jgi:hypothetical protein
MKAREAYDSWLNRPYFSDETKAELQNAIDNNKVDLEDRVEKLNAAFESVKASFEANDPTDDEGGCGGSIATYVAVVAVVSALGTAVLLKKKED